MTSAGPGRGWSTAQLRRLRNRAWWRGYAAGVADEQRIVTEREQEVHQLSDELDRWLDRPQEGDN